MVVAEQCDHGRSVDTGGASLRNLLLDEYTLQCRTSKKDSSQCFQIKNNESRETLVNFFFH